MDNVGVLAFAVFGPIVFTLMFVAAVVELFARQRAQHDQKERSEP